ncbi:enoyl-CoA hydratase/isomerase family protein [Baekduia soli]|uniref:Enoyl-CoA hydratase/isomerase family protein n=1 Tax=Baekduia soli TaxID=496014 RepID=A0A5B8U7U8_9ACTN|nr:enoyl-CoA hydratase-related protein [Baekduia soli]QEC48762.1 enoyl-CoA hydratase/isomerase family protein [Baekduia soli]
MTSSDFRCLRLDRDGDVLRVTIDHPDSKINAVDDDLHHDLTALFRHLKQVDDARAILLTGSKGVFSVGGDFDWFKTLDSPRRVFDLHRDAKQMIWDLLDVQLPIVAAVNGHAMGLAANLALFCDVIFMGESALIADPHVKAGIVAGDGGTAIWPMTIGPARAKEYLLTGDPLTARDAERLGLINHAVPDDELDEAAMAFAKRLAAGAPMAVQYTKLAVNKLIKEALSVSFDAATGYEMVTMLSEDHGEAIESFLNRRPPEFTGR